MREDEQVAPLDEHLTAAEQDALRTGSTRDLAVLALTRARVEAARRPDAPAAALASLDTAQALFTALGDASQVELVRALRNEIAQRVSPGSGPPR